MKIVHISPETTYNDHWGYQENLLTKYHSALGNDVTLIVRNVQFVDGKISATPESDYILTPENVRVIRKRRKRYNLSFLNDLFGYIEVYDELSKIKPDLIFFHGFVSKTIKDAVKYKKNINPNCVLIQDNHMDAEIGFANTLKGHLAAAYYKRLHFSTAAYVDKIYGVTPGRVDYARKVFGASPEKSKTLIMGADDEKINFAEKSAIRNNIRSQYGIEDDEFLIVTGGKLDKKKNVIELMKSLHDFPKTKLLLFGNINDDIKAEFETILKNEPNIIHIGWIDSDKVYDYFFAADLVVFPGTHSVLWEQAVASRVPCVFKYWEGMQHVDFGGNCVFIENVTVDTIKSTLSELIPVTEKYVKMKSTAESDSAKRFLYSEIAKESLR